MAKKETLGQIQISFFVAASDLEAAFLQPIALSKSGILMVPLGSYAQILPR